MKRMCALLLSVVLAASAVGCSREKKPDVPSGGALEDAASTLPAGHPDAEKKEQALCIPYYPDRSMNPYESTDFTNRTLFSLMYQGLFSVDRSYQARAVLCSRFTRSDDMKLYTFYPNTDATFSDGSRLTAGDVAESLRAARDNVYYKGRFLHVDDISVTEDGGVAVQMDTSCENLPLLMDIPIVKASQVGAIRPLGTGPYEFASTVDGAALHRRTNWWTKADMACYTDSVQLKEAESNSQIRDQFEFYDVGMVCTDPCTDTYADYRCDYELWDCENGMFLYLGSNMHSGVFSNAAVRSALTYAIDRETLAARLYRGFGKAISLPASPSSPWYNEALAQDYAYDPERFKSAVATAGLTGRQIKLLVNGDDTLRTRAANEIAEMLRKGGLDVIVDAKGTQSYTEAYQYGNYDLHLGQTRLSPNMDLTPFFAPWGGLSYNGLDDAPIYSMCLDALENSGNYYSLFQMVMDDGKLCPILSGGYAVYADRGLISGLMPARDNVFYYPLGKPAEEVMNLNEETDTDDSQSDSGEEPVSDDTGEAKSDDSVPETTAQAVPDEPEA